LEFNDKLLTIGFALRAKPYKRSEQLFANIEKLKIDGPKWRAVAIRTLRP
jgi:glucan phosphorylase